jgi:hypothetical protein
MLMLYIQWNQPVEFHPPFLVGLVIVLIISRVAALVLGKPAAKAVTTTTKKTAFRSDTTVSNDAVKLRTFLTYHRGTTYSYIDLEMEHGLRGVNLQQAVKDLEGQLIITEQSGVAMYSMR